MSNVNMYSITTFFTEFGVYNTVIEDESGNKKMSMLSMNCSMRCLWAVLQEHLFNVKVLPRAIHVLQYTTVLSADLEIFMTDMGVQKLTSKNEINFADLINEDQPLHNIYACAV